MGSCHYHPDSALTRWQQEKLWELCQERSAVVLRKFGGNAPRPTDKRLQRHLEREIDWYQMKEYKPSHDYWRAKIREVNRMLRKVKKNLPEAVRRELGECPT